MSIDDVNLRLKDRFKLLTGGSRVALERQQTLHALVHGRTICCNPMK